MTREELNDTLEQEFSKVQTLTGEHKKLVADNAKKLHAILEKRLPIDTKTITTEFSRHKVTLLKDFSIVITELNEEQSKSLFDKICQLT
tara:strand:- start:680 stop:946 length:267 start_codon:yes stop_codon:yes gene_type:complete